MIQNKIKDIIDERSKAVTKMISMTIYGPTTDENSAVKEEAEEFIYNTVYRAITRTLELSLEQQKNTNKIDYEDRTFLMASFFRQTTGFKLEKAKN